MQNILFLCLNCCGRYDTSSVLDIVERDQKKWLQSFRNDHTNLSELLIATNFLIEIREELRQQEISLFRSLLEFFDGKVDCRQHDFRINYTTSQNASLCARLLSVFCSCQFGRFDSKEMQSALFKSKLFTGLSKSDVSDILEWSRRIMTSVSVGFSDKQLVSCYQSWG